MTNYDALAVESSASENVDAARSVSASENPYQSPVKRFFVFCSGAEPELLARCETEQNTYMAVGGLVLSTGVMATISSTFAISMAFRIPWYLALPFGFIFGCIIFNLDRWLVSSFRPVENRLIGLIGILPRLALAFILGFFFAEPFIMQIFDPEIQEQLIDDSFATQEQRLESLDKGALAGTIERADQRIEQLSAERTELQAQLSDVGSSDPKLAALLSERVEKQERLRVFEDEIAKLNGTIIEKQNAYDEEVDYGCIDSISDYCRQGPGPIALEKQTALDKARDSLRTYDSGISAERQQIQERLPALDKAITDRRDEIAGSGLYEKERAELVGRVASIDEEIGKLREQILATQNDIRNGKRALAETEISIGLGARIRAFQRVKAQEPDVNLYTWLLRLVFITIDVMPILSKYLQSLNGPSSYDEERASVEREEQFSRELETRSHETVDSWRIRATEYNQREMLNLSAAIQRQITTALLLKWRNRQLKANGLNAEEVPPLFSDEVHDVTNTTSPTFGVGANGSDGAPSSARPDDQPSGAETDHEDPVSDEEQPNQSSGRYRHSWSWGGNRRDRSTRDDGERQGATDNERGESDPTNLADGWISNNGDPAPEPQASAQSPDDGTVTVLDGDALPEDPPSSDDSTATVSDRNGQP